MKNFQINARVEFLNSRLKSLANNDSWKFNCWLKCLAQRKVNIHSKKIVAKFLQDYFFKKRPKTKKI